MNFKWLNENDREIAARERVIALAIERLRLPRVDFAAIKARGDWIPGVGHCAALIVSAYDAEQLIDVYRRGGPDIILPDKAVETGIQSVWELMSASRLKVFATCAAWFDEKRLYHRDERGRIVKTNDHLMDATRYLIHSGMARAVAKGDDTGGLSLAGFSLDEGGGGSWMGM